AGKRINSKTFTKAVGATRLKTPSSWRDTSCMRIGRVRGSGSRKPSASLPRSIETSVAFNAWPRRPRRPRTMGNGGGACHYCNKYDCECEDDALKPMPGAKLIAEERRRQKLKEGFTAERDDKYIGGELIRAALCYILNSSHLGDVCWP